MERKQLALDARTIVDLLGRHARWQPDRQIYTFLLDGEAEAAGLTIAELDHQARAIGGALQAAHQVAESGARVLLLLPSNLEFVTAFFGCLYAGAVAVPAYPPQSRRHLPRLLSIVEDARPSAVLTSAALLPRVRAALAGVPALERAVWLSLDELPEHGADRLREVALTGETLAFLQYTSGSTSSPKGVMVSHGNLLHNERRIQQAFGQTEESVVVSWLPLYHDMGLIGSMLQPLYTGGRCVLMSPGAFLQQPIRWLRAIARYRATTSGGPNFAYDLCVRKVSREQAAALDLSCWSVAFNGAEPVRRATLDRFAEAFAPSGFRRAAFVPCYGLAEATLLVTAASDGLADGLSDRSDRSDESDQSSAGPPVGCGALPTEDEVRIVDPESGAEDAPGQVGEIWISGPSVAQGYWNQPEATERDFRARLAGAPEAGPFLRTGDLGFVEGGELFVTGRLKDLIILRGRNHYPQDIELTVERSHPALLPGGGASFSVEADGEEQLVVLQEVDRHTAHFETIAETIRHAVAGEHEAGIHELVLLRPGGVLKTSSGKVRRQACREEFLAGRLAAVWASRAGEEADSGEPFAGAADLDGLLALEPEERRAAVLADLCKLAAWALRRPAGRIRPEHRLMELGLDSLGAVELQHALESRLAVAVPPAELLENPRLAELADALLDRLAAAAVRREPPLSATGPTADLPLSHGQEALWFLHRLAPESGAYHVAAAARVRPALDAPALQRALAALAERHPALRATFDAPEGEPRQRIHPRLDPGFSVVAAGSGPELGDLLLREAFTPFDLEAGPLVRAALLRRDAGEDVVVLAAHHIVTDFLSFGIITRELAALYARETGGPDPGLPPAADYGACVHWQRQRVEGPAGEELWDYWRERLAGAPAALDLPTDRPRPPAQTFAGGVELLRLDPETSADLARLAQSAGATLFMVLLAAFQTLLHRFSGQQDLLVGSPVSDRARPELAGVVGYFVNPLVLRADLSGDPSFAEFLDRTRRTVLDAFSHQGFPFPLVAERLQPERDPSRSPLFQVMFTWQQASRREERGLAAFALGVEGVRMDLGALDLESMRLPERWSQLDLSLRMGEVDGALAAWLQHSSDLFDAATVRRLLGQLATLARAAAADPGRPLARLPLLAPAERRQILEEWNDTSAGVPGPELIHRLFEIQADSVPGAEAVAFGGEILAYGEVERRANRLAHHLRSRGLGPDGRAGVCLERSADMVVALLAILKTGGAYVPLDPTYPRERLSYIVADAGIEVLVTRERHAGSFDLPRERTVLLDADASAIAARPVSRLAVPCAAGSLAYLIYTSGSTGHPKGVMVTHRNVARFFAGMDERLGTARGCWLAVTSISFDISVLELLWTLTRGWKVVVQRELRMTAAPARRAPGFSLFYFASEEGRETGAQYKLLLAGAKFADRHGFTAVWTPERHFHAFGGLYPNPAVTGAAVAAVTERVGIRAGSVVLPLHHPLRVAEEWSVVDNLSGGRVGVSFASGWNAADFVFAPDAYATRKEAFREQIETVRRLWRGEPHRARGGEGEVEVRILPRPIQPELPVWITAAGSPETFRLAGELGAGVLTHLLGQSLEDVAERIRIYRRAWREAGHGPGEGQVALMLHTFLAEDADRVREIVREPFSAYLASSFDLMKALAPGQDIRSWTESDRQALVGRAFDRYFESSGLFGTPEACLRKVERLQEIGVDEIACLIDFGVGFDDVMESLRLLAMVQERSRARESEATPEEEALERQIVRHGVSHLQCTPSAATAILLETQAEDALRRLDRLLLGGEALSLALADRLDGSLTGELLNMYGPTETTIWSATDRVEPGSGVVTIGRPIANTRIYLLDGALEPVPVGRPGEIHIGGDGVVRGYWDRPALTAERFVPDPFDPRPGNRMYRTGDLARWQADGRIAFLGRSDFQVKVRGHRIELGEIEAALMGHPAVREAAVLAREDHPGDVRLVAYAALRQEGASGEELIGFLRSRLPELMIPSTVVALESLPRTPNGKVDRRALPAPGPASARPGGGAVPRTPTEELLAGIFGELLRRETVGVADDFFELGGHSLLAMQLAARVRAAFGVELPLRIVLETPTVGALAARIEQARRREDLPAPPPLVPVPREGDLPLSFAQERLWFLDRMEPGAPTYNMPGTVGLTGGLDVAAFAAALRGVVDRHEVLRTVFPLVDGRPRQHILPAIEIGLPVLDLAGLPPGSRLAEAERLATEHSRHRFDLARGPLLDAAFLRLGRSDQGDHHHLLVVLHHVICDGWSLALFVRELGALYAAFAAGRPSPLPELPVQYADFAVWQRDVVAVSQQIELAWWMERLGGETAPLDLPTDRPRPAVQTYRGGRSTRILPPGIAARLAAFGRAHGATLFMTLLAAIKALLHRHSGQDDVLIGTPVAGRRAVETEGLIGCFFNTLVLRTDLGGQPGFRDLVTRVREEALGAYSHQDVPFEAVLAGLPQQRDLSRTPLFQVMVNMLNFPSAEMRLPGLVLESLAALTLPSKFDMTFYLREGGDGVSVELVYNADLFDAGRMEDLLAQLETLLDQALERPGEPVGSLSLVTAAAHAILPDPAAQLPAVWTGAVHERFAERARRHPARPAVIDRDGAWSYGDLETAANRLCAWLQGRGVLPGDRVAVYAHRSAPLALALLGILKAGAAFTILDPSYPALRLTAVLAAAAPRAFLRLESAGALPAEVEAWLRGAGCPELSLPRGGSAPALEHLAGLPGDTPGVSAGPDDLAYVAFTSGSTGAPKGILGSHLPLSHFISWHCDRFGLAEADRFSLLSGLAHDPLLRDLFTPLCLGALLAIPAPEDLALPDRFARWMRQEGVTVAHLTPALGEVLAEARGVLLETLRLAFFGGDVLTRRAVERLRRLAPGCACVNYYGATETPQAMGFHEVSLRDRERIPLGRGIDRVQLLVLNAAGRLAGVGELGEICIRTPYLSLGYLGNEELTRERFVASPFTGAPADRLYRTGDLGRYLPDGAVELKGRGDTQVKIRGFRVELGEIEAVLAALPGVREAVVVAREERADRWEMGRPGDLGLVAYVTANGERPPGAGDLRSHVEKRLPSYMVPAAFRVLAELPRTSNGKMDRSALAALASPLEEREVGMMPGTPLEKVLAGMIAEVLGTDRVGLHDNFFDLGGHSMRAVELIARLRDAFGIDLPLFHIFDIPTVAGLASVISESPEWSQTVEELAPALLQLIEPPAEPMGGSPQEETR